MGCSLVVEVVDVDDGSVGSGDMGAFAQPIATLNMIAIPTTTAMKKTGASAKNRRKRAT